MCNKKADCFWSRSFFDCHAYSDIIDNRNTKIRDEVNALLGSSDEAKIAVGYLYLSGFYQIASMLGELEEVRIITGNTLQRAGKVDRIGSGAEIINIKKLRPVTGLKGN
ncbi:MAG: hypothetical protein HY786_06935 [Deltaproteobacteria bacterium]|nr:hypothetical protein [Deltaproteobacteria bacterium]